MSSPVRKIIKDSVPPILLQAVRALRNGKYARDKSIQFAGNFSSWEKAQQHATGYDSEVILSKVRDALLKVKMGEAPYERDSVVFDQIMYPFPVLAGLLYVASVKGGDLGVIDFGGSLGSTYFQCHGFLDGLNRLRWSVVEQPHFVNCGRENFEDETLKFYHTIEECLVQWEPDIILLSGVLQHLERPHEFIEEILRLPIEYIIIDRTPFIQECKVVPKLAPDLLTVQIVSPRIYAASYPAYFFDEEKFLSHFRDRYSILADFDSFESWNLSFLKAQNRGFIMKKTC